jgi:hypothetical protein
LDKFGYRIGNPREDSRDWVSAETRTSIPKGGYHRNNFGFIASRHGRCDGRKSDRFIVGTNWECAARDLVRSFVVDKRFMALEAAVIFEEEGFLFLREFGGIIGFE